MSFNFGGIKTTGQSTTGASGASAGFNFGGAAKQAPGGFGLGGTPATGGLSLGGTPATGGLSLGGTPSSGGFSLGGAQTTTANQAGFNFGTPKTQQSGAGLNFGGTLGTPQAGGGLGLTSGITSAAQTPAKPTLGLGSTPAAASGGFGFGTPSAQTTKPTLNLGGTTNTNSGFNLATPSYSQATTQAVKPTLNLGGVSTAAGGIGGFGLSTTSSGITAVPKPALNLGTGSTLGATGGFGIATTSTGTLGLGATLAQTKPTLTLGATPTATTGFGLGKTLANTTTTATPVANLFNTPTAGPTVANKGLGGVDPKTTTTGTDTSSSTGKPSDSKNLKETPMPPDITATVDNFKKYVKDQRIVREDIARMSSNPMFKVQEEVTSLKQLLSIVSSGLQRNALTIQKLKEESAQELKHSEVAQRTKDTPPGLQYENIAPTEYFQRLVGDFEMRMILYRQQIEEMESHLASLQQPSVLTPQELSKLLSQIYESFLALAAQLQVVHALVRQQKEQFLNYRKVFHGDSTDIFEKRKKVADKTKSMTKIPTTVGPTPFTGMSNAAAVAMASALSRTTQPTAAPTGLGLGATNTLGTTSTGTGGFGSTLGTTSLFGNTGVNTGLGIPKPTTGFGAFGSSTATTSTPFGFGNTSNTAAVRPLGSNFNAGNNSLFGSSSSTGGSLFGAGGNTSFNNASGGVNFPTPTAGGSTPQSGFSFANSFPANTPVNNNSDFQLQKPPVGNKRGKKA